MDKFLCAPLFPHPLLYTIIGLCSNNGINNGINGTVDVCDTDKTVSEAT